MSFFFDTLETRQPAQREAALMAALPKQVAHAKQASAALAQILSAVDPAAVTSRQALAQLPVTRKHELLERQQASRAVAGGDVFAASAPWATARKCRACLPARARSTNPKARAATTGAWHGPFLPLAFARAN